MLTGEVLLTLNNPQRPNYSTVFGLLVHCGVEVMVRGMRLMALCENWNGAHVNQPNRLQFSEKLLD